MLPAYLRMPTIAGATLAFVCDDDLWTAPAEGGVARRVSAGLGEPGWPSLSPDGRWLAYTGRDEAHAEVWVMPAAGGPARRLSWFGADSQVRGWLPDGRILFVSTWGQPFVRNLQAWAVDAEGGAPVPLELGQVNHLSFGPGGARVIGRNTADPARWKRYRGGTAGRLWVDAQGSGDFRALQLPGNPTCPMWLGERLWFLGDHEGVGNLYSCAPDGSGLQRHTDHAQHYARHAASDGKRIVYQCAAELWLFDPALGDARLVALEVPAARSQCAPRAIDAAAHLGAMHLHPQGHSVALEVRGKLVSFALWEGAVQQHGQVDGARLRHGQWLADGRSLVLVSDAGEEREERVELQRPDGVSVLPWPSASLGRVTELAAAPRGDHVALANHRNELWVGDSGNGRFERADHSDAGPIDHLAWSPCGGWLAYACRTHPRRRAIRLLELASGRVSAASSGEFEDWAPAFDPEGRWLYFLSNRTFDPVYDSLQFALGFPRGARPYVLLLRADSASPFDPAPRGMGTSPASPAAASGLTRIDTEGLARRVLPFPVPEGRFGAIAGVAGGKLLWTRLPLAGAHGRGGHKEGPGTLERFDFRRGEAEVLHEADAFCVAADASTVLLRQGQRLRVLAADVDPKSIEKDDSPSRRSGWLALDRVRLLLEPRVEWAQMLREVWRLQRDQFWTADLSGVDWEGVWDRYAPLLPRVATRAELSDLIWELQGELGTSHAYEMGGDHRQPPALGLGQLAADLQWDGRGWAIAALADGDPWDPLACSPLALAGVQARVGERIVAVNGQPLSADRPPQALLRRQAGVAVRLELEDGQARREVLLRPLADETPARYRAWVERQRNWVHQASGGTVGYLHLPDMMGAGFAEFHRHFRTECERDALIVDLRYNRGGHVSELLLEQLARRRLGYVMARWQPPVPYPETARAGPLVALTNEHAGSDGDIFCHGFKLMRLGTLVGTRTWGGVIGIEPRHTLADGSTTTQPEYAFWFEDVGWGVENHGTEPQVEVDNAPQDAVAGRDRQLETALAVAQQAIAREGVSRPAFGERPQLAPPPLPPR